MSKYCFILLAFSCIAGTLSAQTQDVVQQAADMLPPLPTGSEIRKYESMVQGFCEMESWLLRHR